MKKIVSYIILSAIMVTFLPYSALAETTNVGVKITGSASIEVVTTISADITVDLTTGTTTPTYMEIQNNSLVPVSAKITNITTTSEGAPSTFVKASDKVWNNLSKADTKKYVNFNIIGEGQDVEAKDILPNTEIDLGTLKASIYGCGAEAGISINQMNYSCNNGYAAYYNYYELNANLGSNWDEGEKNFTYQIETVYSKADSDVSNNVSIATMEGVSDLDPYFEYPQNMISNENAKDFVNKLGLTDSSKLYFSLIFTTNKESQEFDNQVISNNIDVVVNDIYANRIKNDDLLGMGADSGAGTASFAMLFSIPKLEASSEGTTHYLKVNVTISKDATSTTFTFIKKVIAYSE